MMRTVEDAEVTTGLPALSVVTDSDTHGDADDREPSALACLVIVARHHGLHLTTGQLNRENVLTSKDVGIPELIKCATTAGLKAKVLKLDWSGLGDLGRVLPVIVRLKHGESMVLTQVA